MYKISKEFHFSASHRLEHLPKDHPCYRLHGHNYVATIGFEAEQLDKNGFVIDFRELDGIKSFIDDTFDHQHLNDKMECYTTSENMAAMLFHLFNAESFGLKCLVSFVRVSETPKTMAEYWQTN